ncbi:autotransporter outer membrane beta-barrel domain-containing protein [Roseomonas hellenica]|uniref:Autotransporter outer membrane beta-barrel domain-containing protein n=1 Tax=Plastoroseomonas hellenica TaxID=2687306 RepID=A0ABS5F5E7_9PROT|nr:autotransporter outer membrane beta-barrel domain-containing protein [Plastoroseomonas hellenica]MBR0667767.1 autotransporter outer membrane beta-barrel domain-containing protein [Plastoroseomonas hellenica]
MDASVVAGSPGPWVTRRARLLAGASGAALAIACWLAPPVAAAEYTADSDATLRAAIGAANAGPDASSTITLTGSFAVLSQLTPPSREITIITQGFTLSGLDNAAGAGVSIAFGNTFPSGTLTVAGTLVGGAGTGGSGGVGLFVNSGSQTATGTIVNNGTITGGSSAGGGGGNGAQTNNGVTLVNNGTITGGASSTGGGGVGAQIANAGTLVNAGTIRGGIGQTAGGQGVFLSGTTRAVTLLNTGTILGGSDVTGTVGAAAIRVTAPNTLTNVITNAGRIEGGAGAVAIFASSIATNITLVNSGTIRAGTGQADAIQFASTGTGTLELQPGSVIVGNVVAGSGVNDTLRLAGTGTAILDGAIGAGGQYRGFDIVQKTGAGTWILTGDSTVTSAFQLQDGMLQIGNGGTSGNLTGAIANAGTLVFNRSDTLTHAGLISGSGAVQQSGSGTLILTGANTYTGGTTINAGTLAIAQDAALGAATGALAFNGGALRFDAGFDLAATRAISIAAGGGAIDTNGFTTTIAQGITGAGALTVTGAGTLILTGANSHAGGTILTGGTLAIAQDAALGAASGPLTFNGGTLRFDAGFTVAASRAIGITAAGGTINTNGQTATVAGSIAGPGGLIVTGGGTVILTGANSYTGGTTISAGTVQLGAGGTSGSITGNVLNNGTLTFNRSDALVLAGAISGSGAVRQEGTGTTILTGENTYTGGTTITQGTLQLGNGGTSGSILGNVVNNSLHSLVFNRSDTLVFPGVISGVGAVRQEGTGTTVLTGANTYSGPTSVNAGVLRAGGTNTFSPASAVTVASAGTLALAGFDQTIAGLANAGLVTLGGAPGTRLTVAGNYVGQGGILALNTVLGGDSSATDRLVIQGGTATGSTGLRVTNIGGPGALTTEGIQVVQVASGGTTAAGAFRLDTRAAAGAFEYQLFRGGNASADDWYLRSFLTDTPVSPGTPALPGSPGIPLYRPEVPLYAPVAALGRQMGLATLASIGSLHERVGEQENIRDLAGASPYANGAWARAFGERARSRWDGPAASRATGNLVGLQAGFDILRTNPYAGGHRDHAGVYVAYTDYNAPNVSGFAVGRQQRVGRLLMSGPSVGAYWTHFGPSGWYVDAVFQANWFDVKASSDFGAGISTNGTGYAASLEAGYPIRFGQAGRWQIEPQAQVIWQSVSVDRARDQFSSVDWDEDDAVTGRLGARLQYTGRDERTLWQPYAKVNLWHAFSGSDRIRFGSSAPIESSFGETALEVGAGVTARVNQTTSFYAHADYRWSLGGDSRQTATQGSIGIRFNW